MTKKEMINVIMEFMPGVHNFPIGAYYDVDAHYELMEVGHPDFDRFYKYQFKVKDTWYVTNWYGQECNEEDKKNPLYVTIHLYQTEPEIVFLVEERRADFTKETDFQLGLFGLLDYLESEEIKDIRSRFWGYSNYDAKRCYIDEILNSEQLLKWVLEHKEYMEGNKEKQCIPKEFRERFLKFRRSWFDSEHHSRTEEESKLPGYYSREAYAKEQAKLVKDYKQYLKQKSPTC